MTPISSPLGNDADPPLVEIQNLWTVFHGGGSDWAEPARRLLKEVKP